MDWVFVLANVLSTIVVIVIAAWHISSGVNSKFSGLEKSIGEVNARVARIEGWIQGMIQASRA